MIGLTRASSVKQPSGSIATLAANPAKRLGPRHSRGRGKGGRGRPLACGGLARAAAGVHRLNCGKLPRSRQCSAKMLAGLAARVAWSRFGPRRRVGPGRAASGRMPRPARFAGEPTATGRDRRSAPLTAPRGVAAAGAGAAARLSPASARGPGLCPAAAGPAVSCGARQ
jgi:hypothetical protein